MASFHFSSIPVLGIVCCASLLAVGSWLTPEAFAQQARPFSSLKEIRERGVVMQRWETSCAAASIATVLTYGFRDPVTESFAAAKMLEKTDPAKVKTTRDNLVRSGLYGRRVVVHAGGASKLPYPDWFANVVVCNTPKSAGPANYPWSEIIRVVHPWGGTLITADKPPPASWMSPIDVSPFPQVVCHNLGPQQLVLGRHRQLYQIRPKV